MSRGRIVITRPEYAKAVGYFDALADVSLTVCAPAEEVVARTIRETAAQAVILGVETYVDQLYTSLPRGGVISRFGVGHDGIDKVKATAAGLLVTNTPGVLENAVAEHTMALILGLTKHLPAFVRSMDGGAWVQRQSLEVRGRTLAIIGCGAIGRRVARMAAFGFGMHVIGMDKNPADAAELQRDWGISGLFDTFRDTVRNADIVSLHVPANAETRHLINSDSLAYMPSQARLINTSRGAVVDEVALFRALADGTLAGAALDVFATEPYEPRDARFDLRRLPNVLLTPHVSSSTVEACAQVAAASVQNIRAALAADLDQVSLVNRALLC